MADSSLGCDRRQTYRSQRFT
ncbi:MAG: hypothetical protein K0Q94_2349, partial [Paenibacillus sp.]|nr:hypothetical protein [Paenibacillus sp.]